MCRIKWHGGLVAATRASERAPANGGRKLIPVGLRPLVAAILPPPIININLEHLCARDVDDRDGRLVPNGRVAWTPMFVSSATPAIATAMRSVQRHRPPSTNVLPSMLLGEVPAGGAGHYHIHTGVDFIHWMGSPYYLLTDEDTFDKVERAQLAPTARLVAEIVGTYLEML